MKTTDQTPTLDGYCWCNMCGYNAKLPACFRNEVEAEHPCPWCKEVALFQEHLTSHGQDHSGSSGPHPADGGRFPKLPAPSMAMPNGRRAALVATPPSPEKEFVYDARRFEPLQVN